MANPDLGERTFLTYLTVKAHAPRGHPSGRLLGKAPSVGDVPQERSKEGRQGRAGRRYFRMLPWEQVGHVTSCLGDAGTAPSRPQHSGLSLAWHMSCSSGCHHRRLVRCPCCAAQHLLHPGCRILTVSQCFRASYTTVAFLSPRHLSSEPKQDTDQHPGLITATCDLILFFLVIYFFSPRVSPHCAVPTVPVSEHVLALPEQSGLVAPFPVVSSEAHLLLPSKGLGQ